MSLRLGDVAPDFTADTTQGKIKFHDWIGSGWAILFSHPRDFTPVCTTELGYVARLKPEFDKRNVKAIGLSIDPLNSHEGWAKDIQETQGQAPNFPIIADPDKKVADLYGMIHPSHDEVYTVRTVFVIDPQKKVRLMITYPQTTGRNFDEILRVIDSLQLTDRHRVATPVNWKQGEDVIIVPAVTDEEAKAKFPNGWRALKPYLRLTPQPKQPRRRGHRPRSPAPRAMTVPSGLRALRHRDFRVFFAGQAVALVGSWMQQVAQAWLVLSLTNSPLRLGLVGSLNFLPILLFALVGGAVADRLPKRRLLVLTQSLLFCQTLTLALLIVTDHVRYWHICVLALVWGIANTIDLPVRQAFVVELAGRADVTSAVALNSAAFNVARIVGPAAAGLLIARAGVAPAYFINAGAFVIVTVVLLTVRARGAPLPREIGTTLGEEIREGLAYTLQTPRILILLAVLFVVSLTVFNFSIYVPLFARQVLGLGPEGFGLLMASVGVGAVGGALTLGARQAPPLALLFGTGVLSCAGLVVMSTIGRFGVAAAALFVLGWISVMGGAGCQGALQPPAPGPPAGPITGPHTFIYGGVFPFGAFTVGSISEHWGISWAFRAAGLFGLATLTLVLFWWRRRAREA